MRDSLLPLNSRRKRTCTIPPLPNKHHNVGFRSMLIRHDQIILVQSQRAGATTRQPPWTVAATRIARM